MCDEIEKERVNMGVQVCETGAVMTRICLKTVSCLTSFSMLGAIRRCRSRSISLIFSSL